VFCAITALLMLKDGCVATKVYGECYQLKRAAPVSRGVTEVDLVPYITSNRPSTTDFVKLQTSQMLLEQHHLGLWENILTWYVVLEREPGWTSRHILDHDVLLLLFITIIIITL
jgi:hypothetical protein